MMLDLAPTPDTEITEIQALLERVGKKMTAAHAVSAEQEQENKVKNSMPVETVVVEKVGSKLRQWPDEIAAMPTELTRVALFCLPTDRNGNARKMLRNVRLESRGDIEVLYTGEELSAKDETCWLACLRLGREVPMGQRIYLNLTDLLNELDLPNTGGKRGNRQTVKNRLNRLSLAHYKVKFTRKGRKYEVTTGLLKWGIEDETGKMYIRLDPEGATLFENLAYQPWEVRLALKTDASTRILSYVSGHEKGKPHSLPLRDLKIWCGYSGRLDKFRTVAMAALKEIENKGVLVEGSSKITKGNKGEEGEEVGWIREK